MKEFECIVDISLAWKIKVDAESEQEAKREAVEQAWDGYYRSRNADVSTNDVECYDASEIEEE